MTKNMFGVPCSQIKEYVSGTEVFCTDEIEAFGLAYGAMLAGKASVVYMQDSGFAKCLNVLLGLFKASEMPFPVLILSVRTKPSYHAAVSDKIPTLLHMLDYHPLKIVRQEEC